MRDKWMNIGFETDELKPYIEPSLDLADEERKREYHSSSYTVVDLSLSEMRRNSRTCTCIGN